MEEQSVTAINQKPHAAASDPSDDVVLEIHDIAKSFGPVAALKRLRAAGP